MILFFILFFETILHPRTGSDKTVRVWDVATGVMVTMLEEHPGRCPAH